MDGHEESDGYNALEFLKMRNSYKRWKNRIDVLKESGVGHVSCTGESSSKSSEAVASGTSTQPRTEGPKHGTCNSAENAKQASGNGTGSDPPDDGNGPRKDPKSGHYSDCTSQEKEQKQSNSQLLEALRCRACHALPATNNLHLIVKIDLDTRVYQCVTFCCSEDCSNQERTADQDVIPVRCLQENSIRLCNVCGEDIIYIPIAICSVCQQYMCAECFCASQRVNGQWKCGSNCTNASFRLVRLPDCLRLAVNIQEHSMSHNQLEENLQAQDSQLFLLAYPQNDLQWENEMLEMNELQSLITGRSPGASELVEDTGINREIFQDEDEPEFSPELPTEFNMPPNRLEEDLQTQHSQAQQLLTHAQSELQWEEAMLLEQNELQNLVTGRSTRSRELDEVAARDPPFVNCDDDTAFPDGDEVAVNAVDDVSDEENNQDIFTDNSKVDLQEGRVPNKKGDGGYSE